MTHPPQRYSRILAVCLAVALLCGFHACKPPAKMSITIVSQRTLDNIPSGSGIAVQGNTAYIIGDDATSIYELNLATYDARKIQIPGSNPAIYREPKPVKHDFESATLIDWDRRTFLLAFGSGSKTPTRDSLLLLNLADHADCKLFSLELFYAYLRRETKTDIAQWNIEGATVAGNKLLLANRGNNALIILEANALLEWLQHPANDFPAVETRTLNLPTIDGKPARLSGLCTRSADEILFCASVEDTPDWIADGPILGSFIGSYSCAQNTVTSAHLLYDQQSQPLREKIESLDLLSATTNDGANLIAIADNDDGSSKVFRLRFPVAQ